MGLMGAPGFGMHAQFSDITLRNNGGYPKESREQVSANLAPLIERRDRLDELRQRAQKAMAYAREEISNENYLLGVRQMREFMSRSAPTASLEQTKQESISTCAKVSAARATKDEPSAREMCTALVATLQDQAEKFRRAIVGTKTPFPSLAGDDMQAALGLVGLLSQGIMAMVGDQAAVLESFEKVGTCERVAPGNFECRYRSKVRYVGKTMMKDMTALDQAMQGGASVSSFIGSVASKTWVLQATDGQRRRIAATEEASRRGDSDRAEGQAVQAGRCYVRGPSCHPWM